MGNNDNKDNLTYEQKVLIENYENGSNKKLRKQKKRSKRAEKADMYDMIIANLAAGHSIIEPSVKLSASQIAIGFSNISSDTEIKKYYMITQFPDYLQTQLIDRIRLRCMNSGVKINFYFYAQPHRIDWDSAEMRNRMSIWKRYSLEHFGPVDVFQYRTARKDSLARQRIINSTKYLNEAEMEYKRSFLSVFFIIEVSAKRDDKSIAQMSDTIMSLKDMCRQSDIKLQELRINMIDWLRAIGPFCLDFSPKEINTRFAKKVLTDDVLANFNSFKQGRIGTKGVSLGNDVLNGGPVLRMFKEDPDAADNWLISAGTGGGKSYWLKTLLTYLMASGFIISVMDYEGDEYLNLAKFIAADKPEDVKVVSMGKGSAVYFDPCEIPDLTGDPEVDCDLKENSINFILAIFRVITHGMSGNFDKEEERVMSLAIQRMYDANGVTDKKETWYKSKGLRLSYVYDELKELYESGELRTDGENLKHKALMSILDSAAVYFEDGETKSGTFKQPMSANELYKARFIVFSFGMKGADASSTDPTVLALKQLSVAYVNIQISNYCKYVRKCFNVKVWEEFQRWSLIDNISESGASTGSSNSIIINTITGGRKRGDVNFIITNDLAALLDDNNRANKTLRQNIQNYAIGVIKDNSVRQEFCEKFDLQDIRNALDKIAKANTKRRTASVSGSGSKYNHSFCIVMEDGKKAIVKVDLPKALRDSKLFKTGVDIDLNEDDLED